MDSLIFPKKNEGFLYHGLFIALVLLLVIFKFSDLHLPYFWDELGVYGRAADYQYRHGLGLLPASLPPELSRGHPTLFPFVNATVMRIFGEQVFVPHLFCLCISIILLVTVYIKISKYFSPLTGILSTAMLAFQPLFLAQSGLVLPEIILTLFVFLSLTSYYEGGFFLFGLYASLAMLTKESAVVLPVTVLSYSVARFIFFGDNKGAFRPVNLSFTLLPYLLFGIFILIQKRQNEWYFYPYHIESVTFNVSSFTQQFHRYFNFISKGQQRFWMALLIPVALISALFTNRSNQGHFRKSFISLMLIFSIAFLGFCSISSFYMDRYALALLLQFAIITGAAITTISNNKWFAAVIVLPIIGISLGQGDEGVFNYDSDLGYRHDVKAIQAAVDYAEENSQDGAKVFGNFPAYYALSFPGGGYLPEKNHLVFDRSCDYFILADPGVDLYPDTTNRRLILLKEFTNGYAHCGVYRLVKSK